MLSRTADVLLRIGSGLSIVLLMAAHAKACPSIVTPPAGLQPSIDITGEGEQGDKPRRPKPVITIYHALPALPNFRRTSDRSRDALLDSELLGGHADNSAVAPLHEDSAPARMHDADAQWWRRFAIAPCEHAVRDSDPPLQLHVILASVIRPCGPPIH